MKKHSSRLVLAIFSLALLNTEAAEATRRYGTAGCGLGSVIFGNQKGIIQVFASTSNSTSGNQSFAITSGTSNCHPDTPNKTKRRASQEAYTLHNLALLSREISIGNGKALETFHHEFGCTSTSFSQFSQALQKNYDYIFSAPGAISVLNSVVEVVEKDPSLKTQCEALRG